MCILLRTAVILSRVLQILKAIMQIKTQTRLDGKPPLPRFETVALMQYYIAVLYSFRFGGNAGK